MGTPKPIPLLRQLIKTTLKPVRKPENGLTRIGHIRNFILERYNLEETRIYPTFFQVGIA